MLLRNLIPLFQLECRLFSFQRTKLNLKQQQIALEIERKIASHCHDSIARSCTLALNGYQLERAVKHLTGLELDLVCADQTDVCMILERLERLQKGLPQKGFQDLAKFDTNRLIVLNQSINGLRQILCVIPGT